MTDELWQIWSENPNEWIPINHSCNPNAWLVGLDVVARTSIKKGIYVVLGIPNFQLGEQITMDYATFCADNMKTFECQCGASNCR